VKPGQRGAAGGRQPRIPALRQLVVSLSPGTVVALLAALLHIPELGACIVVLLTLLLAMIAEPEAQRRSTPGCQALVAVAATPCQPAAAPSRAPLLRPDHDALLLKPSLPGAMTPGGGTGVAAPDDVHEVSDVDTIKRRAAASCEKGGIGREAASVAAIGRPAAGGVAAVAGAAPAVAPIGIAPN